MGTEMDHSPENLHWKISAPDIAGNVFLEWTGEGGEQEYVKLGPRDAVANALTDWLGQIGFGE